MAWIESHQEAGRHPKTKKLARLLGVSLPAAVGHLHYLWWWALDFAQDGILDKYDSDDIAEAMEWEGDGDQLVEALTSAGFIDETEHGLMIHDWFDYAGKLLERRAKDRDRKRKAAEAATGVSQTVRRTSSGEGEKIKTEQNAQEGGFAEFWKIYPKKVGKAAAEKAWKKLKPDADLFERIMAAVETAKASDQWQRENGRFIPNPTTWISQARWDDELPAGAAFQQQQGRTSIKPDTMSILARIIAEEEGTVEE